MDSFKEITLAFVTSKFKEFDILIMPKENRSEATILKTLLQNKEQELYLTSINLDTERSIKIVTRIRKVKR